MKPQLARVLTAENAVINTASVQIKTLTVAGKQVTMAVFRQLIEEDIFDWKAAALRGVGWGHVRYLIEAAPSHAINLVWQRGSELRRCIVRRYPKPPWTDHFLGSPIQRVNLYSAAEWSVTSAVKCAWGWVELPAEMRPADFKIPFPDVYRYRDGVEQREEANRRALAEFEEKAEAAWQPMLRAIKDEYDAYECCVAPLFDLPQLFIAV